MKFNIKNLYNNIQKLPKKVIFCKKCTVSNQRPRITFNTMGVCSACEWSEEKHNLVNWKERERELKDLLDKFRSRNGKYDVIVPGSGGKDSFLVAHELKHRYKMNPITITFKPFEWTEVGLRNFLKFTKMGIPNILIRPNNKLHRALARTGMNFLGDPWQPFEYGQTNLPFKYSEILKIKLCFYGENGELEYGGSSALKNISQKKPESFKSHYQKGVNIEKLINLALDYKLVDKSDYAKEHLEFYKLLPLDRIKKNKTELHWFSYFRKWIPQENFYHAFKYYDFELNDFGRTEQTYTKYASLDDKLDGFHFYFSYLKFGLGRATRDAMQDIRNYHITREEGIRLVKRFDHEFPKRHFKWMLRYLSITEKNFYQICDYYRSISNVWKKNNGRWELKYKIYK